MFVPPPDASFPATNLPGQPQALSPDGRHIVFPVVPARGDVRLAIRTFEAEQARELPGTDRGTFVFWSPDSRFFGFFADSKLHKMDITGGPPQIVCDVPGALTGATWNEDGIILFGLENAGLFRVASTGGNPVRVTMPDATQKESHRQPWFLPDARHFLYWSIVQSPSAPSRSIYVGSLDGEPPVRLVASDSKARYADGFLLFVRDETLLAQPFDAEQLEIRGDPVVVTDEVPTNPANGGAAFSVSTTGMLSYRSGSVAQSLTALTWVDRTGKVLGTVGDPLDQSAIQLSPDGTSVAMSVFDPARQTRDLWIHDLRRNVRTRLTFDPGEDWYSAWSSDGLRLVFSASRMSALNIFQKVADGSGAEERLTESGGNEYVNSVSPDGRFVMYHTGTAGSQTGNDLWILPLSGDRTSRLFLQTPFNETAGDFSPDGRWVAYTSNESGQPEVYVVPFLSSGGKWQISTDGGTNPIWRPDGKELFFLDGDTMVAAEVNGTGPTLRVGTATPLFQTRRRNAAYNGLNGNLGTGRLYAVAADGQKFLVNRLVDDEAAPRPITVVTNWTATLR